MDRKAFEDLLARDRLAKPDGLRTLVDGMTFDGRYQVAVDYRETRKATYSVYLANTNPHDTTPPQKAVIKHGGEGYGPRHNEDWARFWTELAIGAVGMEGRGNIGIPVRGSVAGAVPMYQVHGDDGGLRLNLPIRDDERWSGILPQYRAQLPPPAIAEWPS